MGADLSSLAREAAISDLIVLICLKLNCKIVNRVLATKWLGDCKVPLTGTRPLRCVRWTPNMSQLAVMLEWLQDTPPLAGDQLDQLFIEKADWKVALSLVQSSAKREGFATVPGLYVFKTFHNFFNSLSKI